MANRIKGITVEIGGDTTKLSKALEGVNKDIKGTQTQLKDVQKLLKLDPTNTELLSQKHKLLADAVSATKEKLEVLKTAAEQANTALANGEISQQQYDALQREINVSMMGETFKYAAPVLGSLGYSDVRHSLHYFPYSGTGGRTEPVGSVDKRNHYK